MYFQPLEQFNIYLSHEFVLWGFDTPFMMITNYWISVFFVLLSFIFFVVLPLKRDTLVPTRWLSVVEQLYLFVVKLFSQHINNYHALYYFPLISTVFFVILLSNLLGLFPYNFTLTSHIFTTVTLSLTMFGGIVVLAFYYNKLNYLKFFVPSGIDNKPLKYFLVLIEVMSYVIRPFSLAIRLFANMLAGHTLLNILNTFLIFVINKQWFMVFTIPFIVIFAIFILEFAIAFIQAYVFTTLLVIYINDIYNISH